MVLSWMLYTCRRYVDDIHVCIHSVITPRYRCHSLSTVFHSRQHNRRRKRWKQNICTARMRYALCLGVERLFGGEVTKALLSWRFPTDVNTSTGQKTLTCVNSGVNTSQWRTLWRRSLAAKSGARTTPTEWEWGVCVCVCVCVCVYDGPFPPCTHPRQVVSRAGGSSKMLIELIKFP